MTQNLPTAKIILDSLSPDNIRLTTFEVKIHRFVLAEMNTARTFSRNSASSRAIPVKKMLERVQNDPALPLFWGKNQAGMGASEELDEEAREQALVIWLAARDFAVDSVKQLADLNLHKQLANRLLEPWMWHTVIISATEITNFFGQRLAINPESNQPYAQPEMFYAADAMARAYYNSTPTLVNYGEWHLPYIQAEDREWVQRIWNSNTPNFAYINNDLNHLKRISAGRCARVSYLTHDGKRDPQEDINLANKLIKANPMHPSPLEHIATPFDPKASPWWGTSDMKIFEPPEGNFHGWHQFRHEFSNENISEFDGSLYKSATA